MPHPVWLLSFVLIISALAEDYDSNPAVQQFQQYLQINTTSGNDLSAAVEFWEDLASEVGLEARVVQFTEGYPIVVLKWPGQDPSLGSVMLNSHMDVVPAFELDGWTYPPFSAHLDSDGVIWGRGTQDMKSVSIQYYQALKSLKEKNVALLRDVYMTLMPDEETGGLEGMIPFTKGQEFKEMNVGFALDEGAGYPLPFSPAFYQDKSVWKVQVDCYGAAAHGSTFPVSNSTAIGKCTNVINAMAAFREREYQKSLTAPLTNSGGFTSINLNIVQGGTTFNIIPQRITLTYDIRLSTRISEKKLDQELRQYMKEAGGDDVVITYLQKDEQTPATVADISNPYWTAFSSGALAKGLLVVPTIPSGATDGRFVRLSGIPAIGFSPMANTELLAHAVNERVSAKTFLQGIEIYEEIITNLANIPGAKTSADPSVYVYETAED